MDDQMLIISVLQEYQDQRVTCSYGLDYRACCEVGIDKPHSSNCQATKALAAARKLFDK